jgi:DNA-binding transcriptional LysR family regulator
MHVDDAMLNANDLFLFAQAVESGGFAPAARRLGLPKSTISKRVAELEARLGARLAHRTSRAFVLTDVGRDVYDHARAALIEVEGAEAAVQRRQVEPAGVVRLTASIPTVQFELAQRLPQLAALHPKLHVVVHATDRFVDIAQEGFDMAIRSHFAPLPDSGLVQRRLRVEPFVLVASPDYLAGRGTPEAPADLIAHDAILAGPSFATWKLRHADGREASVTPKARMTADESLLLLSAAAQGLGVAILPEPFCRADFAVGRLVRVLPDWTAGEVTTTILTPHRRGQLPSVRAVVDFLAAA